MLAFLQQQVLGLEVTVADSQLVEMLDPFKYLVEEFSSIDVIDSVIADNVVEQLPCIGVLHNQVQLTLRLYYLIQLDHSRVTYFLQYFNFASNSIDICLVLNFVLFQNFNGHFLLRNGVNTQLDLSKSALAQCLINQKVRDLPEFPLLSGSCRTPRVWLDSQNELFECFFLLLQLCELIRLIRCDSARLVGTIALTSHASTVFPCFGSF